MFACLCARSCVCLQGHVCVCDSVSHPLSWHFVHHERHDSTSSMSKQIYIYSSSVHTTFTSFKYEMTTKVLTGVIHLQRRYLALQQSALYYFYPSYFSPIGFQLCAPSGRDWRGSLKRLGVFDMFTLTVLPIRTNRWVCSRCATLSLPNLPQPGKVAAVLW